MSAFSVACAPLGLVGAEASGESPTARNIVRNGGFEEGSRAWSGTSGSTFVNDPENAHSGVGVLRLGAMPHDDAKGPTQHIGGARAGRRYTLTLWVKLEKDDPPSKLLAGVSMLNEGHKDVQAFVIHDLAGGEPGSYAQYTAAGVAGPSTRNALVWTRKSKDGVAYIDDVTLTFDP
jgi:hypothetical protein